MCSNFEIGHPSAKYPVKFSKTDNIGLKCHNMMIFQSWQRSESTWFSLQQIPAQHFHFPLH